MTRVEAVVGGRPMPMARTDRGWFTVTAEAAPGARYGFRLDGGPLRPDPASRRQPDGVHEASALVDPRRFDWSPGERCWRAPPLSGAVLYELHVGTFTPEGTFAAAAGKLAGLAELGVTHVEVMPVNAYNGPRGWGYDGVCWYAVHEPYGGPEGFATFVDACHRAGLAVVLDAVYNHLGPSGNYLAEFGPYLTASHATAWGDALNLDGPGSDAVRAFIIGNALSWMSDYHVDGLRLDAVHGLVDTSAVHLLTDLSAAVERLSVRLRRPLQLVAESDRRDPLTVQARELGGHGLDGQWGDDLHHAIHTALTGESDGYYGDYHGLPDVADTYRRGFLYDGRRYSPHLDRTPGAPLGDVPGHRLVGCLQNHDQIGNRGGGERLTTLVPAPLVRVGVVLLCAAPFVPLLFMGEEHAETNPFLYFTSHPEPELAEAVRAGRRREFAAFAAFGRDVPDPQDERTQAASTLSWARAGSLEGLARRALWRDLLALRRSRPALGNGHRELVSVLAAEPDWLALMRSDPGGDRVLLTVSLAAAPVTRQLPAERWLPLLCSDERRYGGGGARPEARPDPDSVGQLLRLPAWSAVLWSTG